MVCGQNGVLKLLIILKVTYRYSLAFSFVPIYTATVAFVPLSVIEVVGDGTCLLFWVVGLGQHPRGKPFGHHCLSIVQCVLCFDKKRGSK